MSDYSAIDIDLHNCIYNLINNIFDIKASYKSILHKLCDFAQVPVAVISFTENNVLKTYKYTAKDKSLISCEYCAYELFSYFPNIHHTVYSKGIAFSDATGCSEGCGFDFKKTTCKTNLFIGIKLNNNVLAHLSLFDDNAERVWDNHMINSLSNLSYSKPDLDVPEISFVNYNHTYDNVFDKINSFIFISNSETSKILYANKLFKNLFDFEIVGQTPRALFGKNFLTSLEDQSYNFLWHKGNKWFNVTTSSAIWTNNEKVFLTSLNDITEKISYERLIERQTYFDSLTGLPNRKKLELDFQHAVNQAKKHDTQGFVFFMDLDDFSKINDTRGHHYGDVLLKEIASFLSSFESIGINAYRFGGDEFVIIIPPRCSISKEDFLAILTSSFRREWSIENIAYYCPTSIGIAKFPDQGDNYSEIMKCADMAVACAKTQGKNKYIYYTKEIGSDIYRRIEIEHCMHNDIKNNFKNFSLHYQPLINSQTQVVEGCEALLRWNCSSLGSISPMEFIPIAETKGYISSLGKFVLTEAATQCKNWIDKGFDIKVNINLSIGQLIENDFLEKITDIINESGAPYENLTLEVTESIAINDLKRTKLILNELRSLGVCIALDDFGTGYSSLNCLKEIPLSTVKIDKTLIDDIVYNPSAAMFVRTIVNLSHDLEMRVCAEGVEEKEQYDVLRSLDTDIIQGFYFGRPIPSYEFETSYLS